MLEGLSSEVLVREWWVVKKSAGGAEDAAEDGVGDGADTVVFYAVRAGVAG